MEGVPDKINLDHFTKVEVMLWIITVLTFYIAYSISKMNHGKKET